MFIHAPSRLPADPNIRTGALIHLIIFIFYFLFFIFIFIFLFLVLFVCFFLFLPSRHHKHPNPIPFSFPSPPTPPHTTKKGILHSVDWFTTLLALGHDEEKAQNPSHISYSSLFSSHPRPSLEEGKVVDGMNLWPYIYGSMEESPRNSVVVNIDIEGDGTMHYHSAVIFTFGGDKGVTGGCHMSDNFNGHVFKYYSGQPGGDEGEEGWGGELGCFWGGEGEWRGVEGGGCVFELDGEGEGLVDLSVDPYERVNLLLGEGGGEGGREGGGEGGGEEGYQCLARLGREMVGGLVEEGVVKSLFTTVADPMCDPVLRGGWWVPWVEGGEEE